MADIDKITKDLQTKYPKAGIRSINVDESSGTSTFLLNPNKDVELAFIEPSKGGAVPRVYRDAAATVTRDAIQNRSPLDLITPSVMDESPQELYKRAIKYYYTEPIVGAAINTLANLAAKGFENDIDDPNIKQFYDVWAFDVNMDEMLEWIFLDFFRTGHVTTYKVLAKYEPRVSYLSPIPGQKINNGKKPAKATGRTLSKRHQQEVAAIVEKAKAAGLTDEAIEAVELAAKKNIWSKGHLPADYTVLNPELVTIEGNLMFNKTVVKLTPPPELTELLKKASGEQTEEEKELIKALPSDLKTAAEKGGEYQLDYRLVGSITYRKQPYERYAKPRFARAFDSIEYKRSLREADLSTLDGISNYILKITIGNDEYPVTTQPQLEAISQLFNTPSKSFDIVWNHTLNIEKIVSPEIENILGIKKYEQVNDDITGGLAITRALIDGVGDLNAPEAELVVKGMMEEINYARRQVTRWIYREYQQIAEAMGFDRFPKVRWDENILQDIILYMNTVSQLVDRRMLSYNTAHEILGFNYDTELANMEIEKPLVEDGTLGIIGSPWQQQAQGAGGVQPTQKAPKGSPSNGRPTGQTNKKTKDTNPQSKVKKQAKPNNPKKSASFKDVAAQLSDEDFAGLLTELTKARFKSKIEENQ
ncbi:hypothetical protein DRQ25_01535 [Candidatus Fermentibacteria bacterium]|nr:MAG: hypothetical protein DRQ25_01535 [Candidatus Fermentibacteria bacterium]